MVCGGLKCRKVARPTDKLRLPMDRGALESCHSSKRNRFPFSLTSITSRSSASTCGFLHARRFAESLGDKIENIQPCIPVIAKLQAAFRKCRLPIIHTKECHKPDLSDLPTAKLNRGNPKIKIGEFGPMGRILIDGEPGTEFIAENEPREYEHVISKPGKDAFCRTDLDEYLMRRKISGMVITGVTTEVCVQTTMRCANDRGYDCILVEDGTDSYFPEFKEVTLHALVAQGGIVGWTCRSEVLLEMLAKEQ
jgi:nicotinamidase-related amidase